MEPEEQISIDDLIYELSDNEKPLVNTRLVELSNLGPADLEQLTTILAATDTERRRRILERLVGLAEDNLELSFDAIFKFCLKDEDADVRISAIEGLWENEEPSLITPLINLVERDNSEEVQTAAASALGKFAMLAEQNKVRSCHGQKIQESLLRIVNNALKSEELRRRSLEAVSPLSVPDVKQAIREAYLGREPRLKVSSIYAMGKNCDSSWLPTVLDELSNEDTEIRYEAVVACGELESEEAIPHLVKLIYCEDADIQMAALQSLGKIGGVQAKESLLRCLRSPSEAIRDTAKEVLADLKAREAAFFPT